MQPFRLFPGFLTLLAAAAAAFLSPTGLAQQTYTGGLQARSLITQPIDQSKRVTLIGNIHPAANSKNDRGAVPDSMPLDASNTSPPTGRYLPCSIHEGG